MSDLYKQFENLGYVLGSKGIKIGIKPGSILSVVSDFNKTSDNVGLGIDSNDLVTNIADKLVQELSFYKNKLNPALKEFIKEINVKAPIVDTNAAGQASIAVEEIKVNAMIEKLVEDGLVKDGVTDYGTGCSIETGILFPNDFDSLSEVSEMFKSEETPATMLLDDVIVKYSNLELKEFLKKFGILLFSNYSGSEYNNDGRYDYRSLGINQHNLLFLIDNVCLMYGYICKRLDNKVATNVDVESYTKQLKEVKADLEKLMSCYYTRIKFLESKEAVVVNNYMVGDGTNSKVYVLSNMVNQYLEKANISAWDSIHGCSKSVLSGSSIKGAIFDNSPYVTMSTLLIYEQKLVDLYQSFINLKMITGHNTRIAELKRLYSVTARYVWDTYVTEDVKEIACDPELISKYKDTELSDIIVKQVESAMDKFKDGEISQLSPDIAFYIIGKIFFPRTNYYKFSLNTSGNKLFDNFSKLHPDNEITLSALVLLAETIVNELE